uniref:AMP-binding protein n=1 Tax=Bacillus pumilus TaxID=1408 RepID=UPI0011A48B47
HTNKDYLKTKTLYPQFQQQLNKSPQTKPLLFQQNQLTYQHLNHTPNQLPYNFTQKPLTRQHFIPIITQPSLQIILPILPLLKAPPPYLPLHPTYPTQPIHYILHDTPPKYVFTHPNITLPETFSREI